MNIVPTILGSASCSSLSILPTTNLRLEIGHYRRYHHVYSTHAEVAP
jgi:hypothetical protein